MPTPIQQVNYFDKRTYLIRTQPIQFLLKENKPIIISTFIAWKINDPLLFFEVIGFDKNAPSKLEDMINSYMGNKLGNYHLEQLINTDKTKIKIQEIEDSIKKFSSKETKEKYGIEIVKIGFVRISYPSIVTKAVYTRMKTERETEAKRLRSIGEEEAQTIKIEANKKATELISDANKEAIIIVGNADAKSMEIYGKTYDKSKSYFDFIKSIDTYSKILKNRTTLILSTDSKLFKYLEGDLGNE
jgi:membrane protease subunit HflC